MMAIHQATLVCPSKMRAGDHLFPHPKLFGPSGPSFPGKLELSYVLGASKFFPI
jgi:hypothetical protein